MSSRSLGPTAASKAAAAKTLIPKSVVGAVPGSPSSGWGTSDGDLLDKNSGVTWAPAQGEGEPLTSQVSMASFRPVTDNDSGPYVETGRPSSPGGASITELLARQKEMNLEVQRATTPSSAAARPFSSGGGGGGSGGGQFPGFAGSLLSEKVDFENMPLALDLYLGKLSKHLETQSEPFPTFVVQVCSVFCVIAYFKRRFPHSTRRGEDS